MRTRFMLPSEIHLPTEWICKWRGNKVDHVLSRAEALFFPPEWTICAEANDGRPIAAGAVFIPVYGNIGFLGKIVADPEADGISRASAIVALVRAMKKVLNENGIDLAVAMYDEPELSRLVSEGNGIKDGMAFRTFAYTGV